MSGRYIFTKKDLEPLRPFIEHPISRQLLEGVVPIKKVNARPIHVERAEVELPIEVQSREAPDGVPLSEVLKAVQEKVPGVKGLAVRQGQVSITFEEEPSRADRTKIERLLSNRKGLEELKRPPQTLMPEGPAALERLLKNSDTPDAEWLRAFRAYAVQNLIGTKRGEKK
ncbi:MAG: hypothetical protein EPO39_13465 [Candidatus Manganitrophaceae bacterium]|nr:MAG: hypothetical protein EPO39_13465 [Candidatus Manganitrophaceae bacterium]